MRKEPIDWVRNGHRHGKLAELAGDMPDEQFNEAMQIAFLMVLANQNKPGSFPGKNLGEHFAAVVARGKEAAE